MSNLYNVYESKPILGEADRRYRSEESRHM
jgi:hypothetical protein